MFGANKRYLSISINESVVKVAQVRASGIVEKVARASAVDSTSVDDLAKVLKTLLNGFDRKASVLCVIPSSAATSKNIEVPSSDPSEIKSIINLQASRHTPYSREEVLIGNVNLGVGSGNNTKLLLVIAHRNVVKDRLNVLEKCGLIPEKFLFSPEGEARFYAKGLNLKKDVNPLGIIDVGINSVNFIVVARGAAVFTRSIPMGFKFLMEHDGIVKIADELKKSLEAYNSEEIDAPPSSFIVTTDNEAVKSSLSVIEQGLGAKVQITTYYSLIKGNAVKNKLQKEYADDSFLDVIAPAVMIAKTDVNLMPEEIALKRAVEQQSKESTVACIAALVIMLLLGGMLMSKIYFKDVFLNKNLREQYASQKEEVAKLQDKMAQARIIREYMQGRMVSLDAIRELSKVTPNDIYLTGISMDEDGAITLAGISQSMSQVFSYVKALDDSPLFNNAKTKSTSTKKEGSKDVAVFEVVLKLNDGKE